MEDYRDGIKKIILRVSNGNNLQWYIQNHIDSCYHLYKKNKHNKKKKTLAYFNQKRRIRLSHHAIDIQTICIVSCVLSLSMNHASYTLNSTLNQYLVRHVEMTCKGIYNKDWSYSAGTTKRIIFLCHGARLSLALFDHHGATVWYY